MNIYDAHIHMNFLCRPDHLKKSFDFLEGIGLSGFDAIVLAEYPDTTTIIKKMVPKAYHRYVTLDSLANQKDPFPLINGIKNLDITPFLDARFIESNIEQKIRWYRSLGFKGLKLLYVPEEDSLAGTQGMQRTFGRTLRESEMVTDRLIGNAASQGMAILLHADLRKYLGFIEEMIQEHRTAHFNLAHFGFSRRAISDLLYKYPNCFTDLSSLDPFVKKDTKTYWRFINDHQDQVLFGSDALIGEPETVRSSLSFFMDYLDNRDLKNKIMGENYLAYHKRTKTD